MDLYQEARNKDWNCGFALRLQYGYCNRVEGKRTPLKTHKRSTRWKKSSIHLQLFKKSYASSLLNHLSCSEQEIWELQWHVELLPLANPPAQVLHPPLLLTNSYSDKYQGTCLHVSCPCTASNTRKHQRCSMEQLLQRIHRRFFSAQGSVFQHPCLLTISCIFLLE